MNDTAVTDRVINQGRALVRAVEAMGELEPSGWFERVIARLLRAAYKRRLRGLLDAVPDWARAKILGSSGDGSVMLWKDEE